MPDSGRDCEYVGTQDIWELSELSIQFCCEPKILFKKIYLKKNKN